MRSCEARNMTAQVETAATVVPMTAHHWPQVRAIYAAGIASGHSTFSEEPPTWSDFDKEKLPILRAVGVDDVGRVLGWTAVAPVSRRLVYVGVLEHSIYVHPDERRRGIGSLLLRQLVRESEAAGFWTLQCTVFAENTASIDLHLSEGFRVVGTRERIGKMMHGPMAGVWRDTVLLERRSCIVE